MDHSSSRRVPRKVGPLEKQLPCHANRALVKAVFEIYLPPFPPLQHVIETPRREIGRPMNVVRLVSHREEEQKDPLNDIAPTICPFRRDAKPMMTPAW